MAETAMNQPMTTNPSADQPQERVLNWTNLRGLIILHAASIAAILYLIFVKFHWGTVGLFFGMYALTAMSITAGYHRAFAHRAYEASPPLRWFFLIFGAGALQTSLLDWAADHRNHHMFTDEEGDPHSARKGFWWAHVGWILHKHEDSHLHKVQDLAAMPGVQFQHKYYTAIGLTVAIILPTVLASLWGDFWGGLLVAGALRTLSLLHATWCVNSVAHWFGTRPYSTKMTARNSFITAILTGGEGYHNFHHRFPSDYRNAIRWYQYDPTKWFIWTLSKAKLANALKRTPKRLIQNAVQSTA
ncbi:MAG: fatty acid desaturase [Planctomycetes bacterium]|nr:fatty acid desaturase [Planctomycetota bacterium]